MLLPRVRGPILPNNDSVKTNAHAAFNRARHAFVSSQSLTDGESVLRDIANFWCEIQAKLQTHEAKHKDDMHARSLFAESLTQPPSQMISASAFSFEFSVHVAVV